MAQRSTSSSRVAVVTGAGSGIGRAIALHLGRAAVRVIAVGRTASALEQTMDRIHSAGGDCSVLATDIGHPDALSRLDQLAPQVDILVHNAMPQIRPQRLEKLDLASLSAALDSGVLQVARWSQHVLPGMGKRGWGRIVHIGSMAGVQGGVGQIAYATAKSALVGLTRAIAVEAGPSGVTCNLLELGLIHTARIDKIPAEIRAKIVADTAVNRMGTVDEVAATVAFLTSDSAAFITGARLEVSGGVGLGAFPRRVGHT